MQNSQNDIELVATNPKDSSQTPETVRVTVAGNTDVTLQYDANGNLTSDGDKTYEWDALDRLVKITYSDSSTTEFTYNGNTERTRIIEKDDQGAATSDRRFLWCGRAPPAKNVQMTPAPATRW